MSDEIREPDKMAEDEDKLVSNGVIFGTVKSVQKDGILIDTMHGIVNVSPLVYEKDWSWSAC